MTATSPVSTAQLKMRISRHLKNHGERLVQSPRRSVAARSSTAHDGLVVRGQNIYGGWPGAGIPAATKDGMKVKAGVPSRDAGGLRGRGCRELGAIARERLRRNF